MVRITPLVQQYTPKVCKIGIGQKPVCPKNLPKLDRFSIGCSYFGSDSAENIQKQLNNQMALSWLKSREQNISVLPPVVLSSTPDTKHIEKSLNKLKETIIGRLTITDKLFGKNGEDGTHTIGLVYNGSRGRGKYVILDSLSESYPKIKECHEKLIKFLGLKPKEVVFSNKAQQSLDEYTCNNWTHANLDAVSDYLKTGKEKDLTPEVLDKILPDDINKVLFQQFKYTSEKLKGRDLSELVSEFYNKKHGI